MGVIFDYPVENVSTELDNNVRVSKTNISFFFFLKDTPNKDLLKPKRPSVKQVKLSSIHSICNQRPRVFATVFAVRNNFQLLRCYPG